ncbi:MAG: pseudouridine synthase [Christensenellales bacterium]|jgi:16S rRNA pseudouridine516 synthase
MRLDRLLSQAAGLTRNETRKLIKGGLVSVHGAVLTDPATHVEEGSPITLDGKPVDTQLELHLMMHKPTGLLTAARDSRQPTVMDLLPDRMQKLRCMPVGRLDKDTSGLLLFTTDGELAHRLLAPQRDVTKEYQARVTGKLTNADIAAFEQGIALKDFTAKPAELVILQADEDQSLTLVRLQEGKNRQVRRMFQALGHEVLSLSRLAFGPLRLEATLQPGSWRELTKDEITRLKEAVGLG